MKLDENFNQQDFTNWIEEFLPDFSLDIRNVDVSSSLVGVKSINTIGESGLNVRVYIIETDTDPSRRKVGLATDSFNLLKNYGSSNAIIAYYSKDEPLWRISLLTSTPVWSEGKIIIKLSNPKRQSYVLGSKAKIKTPYQYLLNKGKIIDFDDLKSRFSLEVVNKEFYKEISQAFNKLVGGLLKLPSTQDKSQTNLEFAVRLIGRIIFCWFLREKNSEVGLSLMPKDLLSISAVQENKDYYHKILEPIFFEVLNRPVKSRREEFVKEPFSSVPYLNGGLFSPQEDDFYKRLNGDFQSQFHNTLVIPDSWLNSFFEILETYNFTIDENTSYDEELSIDPEMLGRIFENLLAEINPETGESARKSTGSYYTPRTIVNYMVDESLLLYLKEQTSINEEKLRAIISYDLSDDSENPIAMEEKEKIVEALEKVKILDPACGSGAFPIGALQKIVFILQQTDPDGQLWFKRQIKNTSPEVKRVIEKEFEHKNFDYIRKLGIIRENIYGVDIQSIATEISRLRCFLTLIVDERIQDGFENRGIEPLPNLDFKFVTANSLIGLPKIDQSQQSMFDDYQKIDDLKNVRDQYFNASGIEREQLKTQFVMQQKQLVNQLIKEHGFMGVAKAELTQKLTDWEPFTHKSTSWFDPEWMFGIKDGFDITIANPPYIKEDTNKHAFESLRKMECYQGKMDIWYLFGSKMIDILKDKGVMCFIATNNWVSNDGASKFRNKVIRETKIIEFIDFGDKKIFSAGIQTMVYLISKNDTEDKYSVFYKKLKDDKSNFEILQNFLKLRVEDTNDIYDIFNFELERSNFVDEYINFISPNKASIINKIRDNGDIYLADDEIFSGIDVMQDFVNKKHLEKIKENIKVGDGIFVLSNDEFKSIEWNKDELEIIKPYYTTKEINRYKVRGNNKLWIIYTSASINRVMEKYPNIRKHLDKYQKIITSVNKPYGLHRTREESIFLGEKLLSIRKCAAPSVSYVNFPCYVSRAFLIIKSKKINLKYLCGFMNSKLVKFWLLNKGKLQGNLFQVDKNPLLKIPIKNLDYSHAMKIIKLVDRIEELIEDPQKLEDEINDIFYKIYDFTPEEIAIIEGLVQQKKIEEPLQPSALIANA